MKKAVNKYGLFLFSALLTGFSAVAGNFSDNSMDKNKMDVFLTSTVTVDNLVGGWSYTAEGAPAGYEKGLLMIVREGDSYKVQMQVGGGTLLGENVKVKGNTITFEVMVEGGRVSIDLTAKRDTITGKSTAADGSYTINGEKTLSMD